MERKKKNRAAAALLCLLLILAILPTPALAVSKKAPGTKYKGSDFSSDASMASKLDTLLIGLVYDGVYHYFTVTGEAGDSASAPSVVKKHPRIKGLSVSDSNVAGSGSYGFGQFVYAYLFGEALGDYNAEKQGESTTASREQLSGSNVTVNKLRSMMLRSVPGDVISMTGSSGTHTVVFLKATEDNMLVLHCNYTYKESLLANDVTVGQMTYKEIASSYGDRVSRYHSKKYNNLYRFDPCMSQTKKTEATCTTAGNSAYWYCSACNKYYSDKAHTKVIEKDNWMIPAGHKGVLTPAASGSRAYYTCSECGKYFSDSACTKEISKDSWELATQVPTLNSAAVSGNKVTIKWNSVSGATKYAVYRKTENAKEWSMLSNKITGTSYTDSDSLNDGVTYIYTVRAYASGWSGYNPSGIKATIPAPGWRPEIIMFSPSASGIRITWKPIPGATKYAVFRHKEGLAGWGLLDDSVIDTAYSDDGKELKAGVTYYYTVRAYVDGKWRAYDTTGKSCMIAPALAPVLTSAIATPGKITVIWRAEYAATKYAVYRKASGESAWTRLANDITGNSYTDKSAELVAGTTYYNTVKAYVNNEWGSYDKKGISAKAVTADVPALKDPKAAAGQITVKWGEVSGVTKYGVYRKAEGDTYWKRLTNSVTDTSYTDKSSDLKAGTKYYYTVNAYVSGAWGSYDPTGVGAVAVDPIPKLTSATASAGQIVVKWNAVTNAAKYAVYRKAAGESSWTRLANDITGTSYTDKSAELKAGTTYYYTVRAYVNSAWGGCDTTGVSAKAVAPAEGSSIPVLTSATASAGQITVKWNTVTNAAKYAVYRKAAGESSWTRLANDITGTGYTDKSAELKAGTTYYYTVRAYVNSAWGGYDTTGVSATAVASAESSAFPGLTSATASAGQITVKWNAVTNAAKYAIYRKAAGESSWTRLANDITGTGYTDKSAELIAGTTYYYTVKAYVNGAWSGNDPTGVSAEAMMSEADKAWKVNELEDGTVEITGYTGTEADLVIPGTIGGKPVTRIGASAFYEQNGLTSVTIPDSVTSIGRTAFCLCENLSSMSIGNGVTNIGDYAFNGCRGLTSVMIPAGVTNIGEGVFVSCVSLTAINVAADNKMYSSDDGVLFDKNKTTLIAFPGGKEGAYSIPDSVTGIGDRAFCDADSLTNVTIPDSVTGIGTDSFAGCDRLTSVMIGSGVTSLGENAFNGCSSLTSVTLGSSVTNVGAGALSGCNALTNIDVASGNDTYCSIDGILFSKDKTLLIQYPGGKQGAYSIPASVTVIGDAAFLSDFGLTSVTIPDSVTSIGNEAFFGCFNLTNVTIGCSVTSIGSGAFQDCISLTSATIPASVTSIGSYVFDLCPSLMEINVASDNKNYCSADGVLFNKDKTTLLACPGGRPGAYSIPAGVTRIGVCAFGSCGNLTDLTIPDSVTSIGYLAFYGCSNLKSVAIPDSVVSIDSRTFEQCTGLTDVTFGSGITYISGASFFNCMNLKTVTIPASVTVINMAAFEDCIALTDVYFGGSKKAWDEVTIEDYNEPLETAAIHFGA